MPKRNVSSRKEESIEEEDLNIHNVDAFIIIPPPPQPAAKKRKGTGYIHPNLPQPPFSVTMVGPRKTGKSVTLRNMLDSTRNGTYGRAFKKDNIVFHSPTRDDDETVTSLNLKWVYGPETNVQLLIADIIEQQDVYKENDDMADVLMVFDDATNTENIWPIMIDLGHTGRHKGLNTIVVVHRLTAMPRSNRLQSQQWMLFKPHEESEREWILYMFSRRATKKIWMNAMHRAWEDKRYNFIYIDFERTGMENIYRNGFNEPLFTPEEIQEIKKLEYGMDIKRPGDEEMPSAVTNDAEKKSQSENPPSHFDNGKKKTRRKKKIS